MTSQMPPLPPAVSWEGDGTLHSYCYDYMRKRGWTETAHMFARDAGINEDEWKGPPIEAPQGLLYEWWSVFWDVFISRSQKTGQRNLMADSYVEAMRQKRDPLLVQFAGQPGMQPITLPRSLTHPPRGPPTGGGGGGGEPGPGPRYVANPGPPMGQQRPPPPGGPGGPPPGSRAPPGPGQPVQYHQQPPPFGGQPGGPPSHLQGAPHPHAQAPLPPGMQPAPYPPNMQQTGSPYPSGMHPPQPGSAHSSPHLAHMAPPFRGGQGPPPTALQRQQQDAQNHSAMIFQQAMQAIGLAGRNPEELTMEEQNAVQNHIRKSSGGQPPTPQQQFRPPPQRVVSQQRMHPDMQPPPRQNTAEIRGPYPAGTHFPNGPPRVYRQDSQQDLRDPQQQQMMHHQQQQQQQHQLQREHLNQAINQPGRQPQHPPPGGGPMHPQLQYASSQVGSPASPNYSGSPYNAPIQLQQQHTGGQGSPPAAFPPAPASRGGNKARSGSATASSKMSPANSKRGGNLEDPSPRSRKRAKPGVKDEDGVPPGGTPETPRFDMSGPSSPGTGMPMGGQAPPYQASRSPMPQDLSTRGALDALLAANARMPQQQAPGSEYIDEEMMGGNSNPGGPLNRDPNVNGNGAPNGHNNNGGGGANGSGISRPSSSASNYLNPSNAFPSDVKHSPSAPSPHPSMSGMPDGGGFGDITPSATMHISLPPPMPMSSFQVNPTGPDATPGGSRPFAGHPQHVVTNGSGDGISTQPTQPSLSDSQASYGTFDQGTDEFLDGGDLSGLDFAFSSFIDDSIFKDDSSEVPLSL
ncbi:hypothetical protein RQP46_001278 [Phenoliferia psychrophenolica]